jgi:hypothetical protein
MRNISDKNCSENKIHILCSISGPGSSVSIATGYGLEGPGIEFRWGGKIFRTCPDRPWGPSRFCTMDIGSFLGVKSGRGVTLTPHPLLVPWSWKSTAIPLLPLWAVRPAQSLSACTRVTFTFPLCSMNVFWKLYRLWDKVEKYGKCGETTYDVT